MDGPTVAPEPPPTMPPVRAPAMWRCVSLPRIVVFPSRTNTTTCRRRSSLSCHVIRYSTQQPAGSPEPAGGVSHGAIEAVPVRHPGRWLAAVVVAIIAVLLIHSIATNPRFAWGVVGDYLFEAVEIEGPKVPDTVLAAGEAYRLR